MRREGIGFCYDFSSHRKLWSWMKPQQVALLLEETSVWQWLSETQEDCMGHQTSLKCTQETTYPSKRKSDDDEKLSIVRADETEKHWIFRNHLCMRRLFQMENIDILSCNLAGTKPRYGSALNEISGNFFSTWIPQVNAGFVLLLQAYSICYILFFPFSIYFLFSI